jgi:hypothetical protein
MNKFKSITKPLMWFMALLLVVFVTGCNGGGQGQILGVAVVAPTPFPPTVTAVAPLNNAVGVPINNTIITAQFSEPMAPITGAATFTVTCAAPCVSPTATGPVPLDVTNRTATFTSAANLTPLTSYTATVTGAKSLATGLALASPYVWTFTTAATPDIIKPQVLSTFPANLAPAVPLSTGAITAIFNKDMAPLTINSLSPAIGSFTLACATCVVTAPTGNVNYVVGSKTATFTLVGSALEASKTYTATITTAATDLAGNHLAGIPATPLVANNYVWTFTTAAAALPPPPPPAPAGNIVVSSTHTLCPNAVNATFTVPSGFPLNTLSITSNFTVTGVGPAFTPVPGAVAVDLINKIATFTPTTALTPGTSYIATIAGGATGVEDTAATPNTLSVNPFTLTFTPGTATGACVAPARLVAAAPFGDFGGAAGMTNQGINTIINGDIGTTAASTLVTGFHDTLVPYTSPLVTPPGLGCTYTETTLNIGTVANLIYTAAPPPTPACPNEGTAATAVIADAAALDAWNEFNALAVLPAGLDVSTCAGCGGIGLGVLELGGRTLAPGTYDSASTYGLTLGDLTLDAGGNANAVWVFRMGSSLTVGGVTARSVNLINGAQAKNVFWVAGTGTNGPGRVIDGGAGAATINGVGGGTMVGTIITTAGVTFSTAGVAAITTLNGRALSVKGPLVAGVPSAGASVTMVNTVINVPAP